jgi:lysyl-tRNA synthetase class II
MNAFEKLNETTLIQPTFVTQESIRDMILFPQLKPK